MKDLIWQKTARIKVTTIHSEDADPETGENTHMFSVYATLPWHSPYLSKMLGKLFGLDWFFKYRLRYVTAEDHLEITYRWGYYETPDAQMFKQMLIGDSLTKEDGVDSIPAGYNTGPIDPQKDADFYDVLKHLEEQLVYSVAGLDKRPDLMDTVPHLYWDIGLVRGQMLLFDEKKGNFFNTEDMATDEKASEAAVLNVSKRIVRFVLDCSEKGRLPSKIEMFSLFKKLLQIGSADEVMEGMETAGREIENKNVNEKYKSAILTVLMIIAGEHLYKDGKPINDAQKIRLIKTIGMMNRDAQEEMEKPGVFSRIKSFFSGR